MKLRTLLFHILLLLVFGMTMVFFMPREKTFSYDYEIGKPWRYDPIVASEDFAIEKSAAMLQAEHDSISAHFMPFYTRNVAAGERLVQQFAQDCQEEKIADLTPQQAKSVVERFGEVYQAGVLDEQLPDSVHVVRVRTKASSVRIEDACTFFTVRTAYQHIMADSSAVVQNTQVLRYIKANLHHDLDLSRKDFQAQHQAVSSYLGAVQSGEKIIGSGEIVTSETARIIETLRHNQAQTAPSEMRYIVLGSQLAVVALALLLFLYFLYTRRKDYFASVRAMILFYTLITLFSVATSLVEIHTDANAFLIPYAMCGMFVCVFMDSRCAFMVQIVTLLICSLSVNAPHEFILVEVVASTVGIYSIREFSSRSHIFRTALCATLGGVFTLFFFDISHGATPSFMWYEYIAIAGVILLCAYPIMYLFEKLFGFTSSVTLIELSNVNTPLMRQMSKEAQGTFNHSMQVANLAAEVATVLEAKVELVRTGAMYHDIGKLRNPAFFTENQAGVNPHDGLPPERSAQIVINHIRDGIELAEKHHLPAVIKSFIATHHGKGRARYFYNTWCNAHPGEAVPEELFTYPGPKPTTREQAIICMADSVEAASRSLKEITEDKLRDLVNKIVDTQMSEGYFEHCPLTYRDIAVAKQQFVSSLKTIYHTRISYPDLNEAKPKPKQPRRKFRNWSKD